MVVKAVGLDAYGRGSQTISDLTAINDTLVIKERTQLLAILTAAVKHLKQLLKEAENTDSEELKNEARCFIERETAPDRQFAGFRRVFFRKAGLGDFVYTNS